MRAVRPRGWRCDGLSNERLLRWRGRAVYCSSQGWSIIIRFGERPYVLYRVIRITPPLRHRCLLVISSITAGPPLEVRTV